MPTSNNLYTLHAVGPSDWDEFDGFVVAAPDPLTAMREAQLVIMSTTDTNWENLHTEDLAAFAAIDTNPTNYARASNWRIEHIGTANADIATKVIIASFNAG